MEQLKAIILAAGKGTRMKSELPKVVHRIDGQCLVDYVIDAAKGAGATDICLVVGYKHEVVEAEISHKDVQYALQTEQLGTGHAVKCAGDFLDRRGRNPDLVWRYSADHGRYIKEIKRLSQRKRKYRNGIVCDGRRSDRIWTNYPR